MGTNCASDGNIFIREEWRENIVHIKTGNTGGSQHVHVNGELIRAVAALDHDYLVQKITVKYEPQAYKCKDDESLIQDMGTRIGEVENDGPKNGPLQADDHWNEGTDEIGDFQQSDAHNSDCNCRGQSGHCKMIKNEQYDLSTNKSIEQNDYCQNNFVVVKKECAELINDDMTKYRVNLNHSNGEGCNGGRSMIAEDHWSDDTLSAAVDKESDDGWNGVARTFDSDGISQGIIIKNEQQELSAKERLKQIDDNQNNVIYDPEDHHGELALSPGEFIEEIDDGCADDDTTNIGDGLCTRGVGGDENEDPRAMLRDDSSYTEMPLSPGKFIEEVYDDWDTDAVDSSGKVDTCEEHDNEDTKEAMMLDKFCTVEAKTYIPSSTATEDDCSDTVSAENHLAKTDSVTKIDGDWLYSVPEDYIDYEEYDYSVEGAIGDNGDADDLWTPCKNVKSKGRRKKYSYVCRSCGYECDKPSLLELHVASSKTCDNPYGCDFCDERFMDRLALKGHIEEHSEKKRRCQASGKKPYQKKYYCDSCSYRAPNAGCLKSHQLIHTGEKPYVCSVCNYATRQSGNLNAHNMKKHSEKPVEKKVHEEEYSCDICSYRAPNPYSLKTHKLIHCGDKAYVCPVCNYAFRRVRSLNAHMEKHLDEKSSRKKPHWETCDVCNYRATNPSSLKTHKLIHSSEKPYVCPVCNHTTRQLGNLKIHMERHSEKRPSGKKQYGKKHSCDICSYGAPNSSSLKVHKLIHSGGKVYVCPVCSYAFRRADNLKIHMEAMRHSVMEPTGKNRSGKYSCDVCSYSALHPSCLKRHKLIHSDEKPYACSICNHATRQVGNLKIHMKRHHGSGRKLNPSELISQS